MKAAQASSIQCGRNPATRQGRRHSAGKTRLDQPSPAARPAVAEGGAPADNLPQNTVRVENASAETQLVREAQLGSEHAFELLVWKYQNRVIHLAGSIVGEADAPDLAQEAFIKCYRDLPQFRGQSAFYTWLYQITVNTCKNHLVSRRRRPLIQDIDAAAAERSEHADRLCHSHTPENCLLADEVALELTKAVNHLPDDLQQAIVLREIRGLSYEEIAEAMDCPVGTVRSRLFRARDTINVVLQPLLSS